LLLHGRKKIVIQAVRLQKLWSPQVKIGGQSSSHPSQIVLDSNSSKRNLHLGIIPEHVYATYEQDMGSNKYDVFLVKSDEGDLALKHHLLT
jgi:hypothetical protein